VELALQRNYSHHAISAEKRRLYLCAVFGDNGLTPASLICNVYL
jgi:hypothetical protein